MDEKEKLEEIKDEELDLDNEVVEDQDGDTQTPSEVVEEEQQSQPDEAQVDTVEEDIVEEQSPQMFSQEQLNEIVGRTRMEAREKALRSMLERYGVDTEDELNDVFGKGQAYGILNENYNNMNNEFALLKAENALLKSKINPNRWDDAKFILNGKGLDVTEENILMELATHPEWLGNGVQSQEEGQQQPFASAPSKTLTVDMAEQIVNTPKVEQKQPSTIRKMGSSVPQPETSNEDSMISKLFGLL